MLSVITPTIAVERPSDESYIVNFYWRANPVLARIMNEIKNNSCGALRSLRFTWSRPKNKASSEEIFLGETLPAAIDGAWQLANSPLTALRVEKVPDMNNLLAIAQIANGNVADIELNECLPLSMPDTCFIKANFTNGHITNPPLVGHLNEEGAIMATDDTLQTMICENNGSAPGGSMIEQMQMRFRLLAEQDKIPSGNQGATAIMDMIYQAMGGEK